MSRCFRVFGIVTENLEGLENDLYQNFCFDAAQAQMPPFVLTGFVELKKIFV